MEHREYYPWGSVSFWRGGTASNKSEADRHRLEVRHGLHSISLDFSIDAMEQYKLLDTIRALRLAFDCGSGNASREIRRALGVTEVEVVNWTDLRLACAQAHAPARANSTRDAM